MRSSTMPPESFVNSVYCAWPASILSRSFDSRRCRSSFARGPSTSSSPMWETSKAPQSSRTARCSAITPSYWTGSSQPANGTMRPPSATWAAWSGVRRNVCTRRMLTGSCRSPWCLELRPDATSPAGTTARRALPSGCRSRPLRMPARSPARARARGHASAPERPSACGGAAGRSRSRSPSRAARRPCSCR